MLLFGALGFGVSVLFALDYSLDGPTSAQWIALAFLGASFGLLFQGCRTQGLSAALGPKEPGTVNALGVVLLLMDRDTRNMLARALTSIYAAPFLIVAVLAAVLYLPPIFVFLAAKSAWEGVAWLLSRRGPEGLVAMFGVATIALLLAGGWWGPFLLALQLGLFVLSACQLTGRASIRQAGNARTA